MILLRRIFASTTRSLASRTGIPTIAPGTRLPGSPRNFDHLAGLLAATSVAWQARMRACAALAKSPCFSVILHTRTSEGFKASRALRKSLFNRSAHTTTTTENWAPVNSRMLYAGL